MYYAYIEVIYMSTKQKVKYSRRKYGRSLVTRVEPKYERFIDWFQEQEKYPTSAVIRWLIQRAIDRTMMISVAKYNKARKKRETSSKQSITESITEHLTESDTREHLT